MKITRNQIQNLITNGTIVDIHIQVPVLVGMELYQQFEQGVEEFTLAPVIVAPDEPAGELPASEPAKRSKK